ncbi:hypothetical protein KXS07_23625 [Inquilinus limosus]|uniref:hypothetical protein n=1 Tax=Inquilinus limosus TaxID=171674 RepID=UPI003F175FD4
MEDEMKSLILVSALSISSILFQNLLMAEEAAPTMSREQAEKLVADIQDALIKNNTRNVNFQSSQINVQSAQQQGFVSCRVECGGSFGLGGGSGSCSLEC